MQMVDLNFISKDLHFLPINLNACQEFYFCLNTLLPLSLPLSLPGHALICSGVANPGMKQPHIYDATRCPPHPCLPIFLFVLFYKLASLMHLDYYEQKKIIRHLRQRLSPSIFSLSVITSDRNCFKRAIMQIIDFFSIRLLFGSFDCSKIFQFCIKPKIVRAHLQHRVSQTYRTSMILPTL